MRSLELIENGAPAWVFPPKETLKVEGLIDGKDNSDRKVDKSLWRILSCFTKSWRKEAMQEMMIASPS